MSAAPSFAKPTEYDPEQPFMRGKLAAELRKMIEAAGFSLDKTRTRGELVFSRRVTMRDGSELPNTDVVIYTTIDGAEVRQLGEDAIRVCVVFKQDGKPGRGLAKDRRVFRTGTIEGIVERAKQRMRDAWATAKQVERCRYCGAPTFTSRAGNTVCAAICFDKKGATKP